MYLSYPDVNYAFQALVEMTKNEDRVYRVPSRNGPVIKFNEPMAVTYREPRNRVLLNKYRDCNPFFHLFEAMWMLAGKDDVEPLAFYNSRMKEYSDDEETFNGAYGYRWRKANIHVWDNGERPHAEGCPHCGDDEREIDQLEVLINHLRENPHSRRAVLQMWNVEDDLLKIDYSKDVCCNTNVYFSCRDVNINGRNTRYLNMTVCNRSNDLIWGMLGANVVHFSFLQEYVACSLGWEVGHYTQFSNDLHVYEDNYEPTKWLSAYSEDLSGTMWAKTVVRTYQDLMRPINFPKLFYSPKHREIFDRECKDYVENFYTLNYILGTHDSGKSRYETTFLDSVAVPMSMAFANHKHRRYGEAIECMKLVAATDWKHAGMEWILKRQRMWEERND